MSESQQHSSEFTTPRLVLQKYSSEPEPDHGATLWPCIGKCEPKVLDPFVTMAKFEVGPPYGFHDHPHRGFQAVTYMLEGVFVLGCGDHKGAIGPGDAQWMTVGRGIIHSEMPGDGICRGVQIWITLPSKDKMMEPNFKEVSSKDIPKVEKDGVEVRVIAGEAMGVRVEPYTQTPVIFLDFTLKPGSQLHQSIPESWNAMVFTLEGEGVFGTSSSEAVAFHHVLVLSPGDGLSVWNKSLKPLRFLLLGGEPLGEPVVQRGPFVMNTQAEIDQTVEDFKLCRNGFEMAKV